LQKWREERAVWIHLHPKPWSAEKEKEYHQRFTRKLEVWLDEGAGSCLFRDASRRRILEEVLMRFQGIRVEHHAWVIMPNHVHLLFSPKDSLEALMKGWKGTSARMIGLGSIWQPNYRDTLIRDAEHFANAVRYIRRNPAKLPPENFTLWEGPRALTIE
jgi:REP element-mobilizing transposase RayT